MTETTIYPAWQKTIRDAQAALEVMNEAQRDIKQREAAEKETEFARDLGKALGYFGIEACPVTNDFILDNIHFELNGGWYGVQGEAFSFTLNMGYVFEGKYKTAYEEDGYRCGDQVSVAWKKSGDQVVVAGLAYSIDRINERATAFMQRVDSAANQPIVEPAPIAAPDLPMSISDTLVELLRKLIREQVSEELDSREY